MEETRTQAPQFLTYTEAVDWINGLIPFGIRPGLQRMEAMLDRFGRPERRLKFIHVAGTNGKGSVCAYLTEMLSGEGYEVGTFTSPYLDKFTSRIRSNGKPIAEEQVVGWANLLKPIADELAAGELGSPTMFEIVTCMAILHFAKEAYPDYVVWETGLGGRLDCTNVVYPVLCVITNVGHDHMDVLGDTLELIAKEKAGIIKPGVPVVSAVDQPEAAAVIRETAKANRSTLYLAGERFRYDVLESVEDRQTFDFESPFRKLERLEIGMNGLHQVSNAACAMMAIEVLRQFYALVAEDETLRASLKRTRWAGRLEMASQSPRILLDGAHNPEGAAMLADALKRIYRYNRLHFLVGMLETKNHRGYFQHILPLVDTLIVTEPDFRKKMDAGKLADIARDMAGTDAGIKLVVEPDWRSALALLRDMTAADDLGVVSGTLYLISDVRSSLLQQADSEKGW